MDALRVLYLEDDPEIAGVVADQLQNGNPPACVVHVEWSLRGALVWLAAHEADTDVVLLDVGLPGGLSQKEVLAAMLAKCSDVPVVVFTGSESADLERFARRAGAADYLTKPARRTELLRRLMEAVATAEQKRALQNGIAAGLGALTAEARQCRTTLQERRATAGAA